MVSFHPRLPQDGRANIFKSGFVSVPTIDVQRLISCTTRFVWSPIEWRDGVRLSENFIASDICALDFDSPQTPIDMATQQFKHFRHIIATTKSHQVEKNGITCDRFRVILFWSRAIQSSKEYSYNMKLMAKAYNSDPAPTDAARFFFPSKEIISIQGSGILLNVIDAPPDDNNAIKNHYAKRYNKIPFWLENFLERGVTVSGGRNATIYAAAIELKNLGYSIYDASCLINKSPFDRTNFSERETDKAIKSGFK